jgi:hypothetical protein
MAADGTFTISGMDPGAYRMAPTITPARGTGPGTPWILKSAMLNGRDLADVPVDIRAGEQITDVVVTFTDRHSELAGTLFDAAGQPAPGFYVVAIPPDEALWAPGTRRMPAPARAATNGSFRFAGLPPGNYILAAVTSVDQEDLGDATFVRRLVNGGVRVTLAEGERRTQDVRFSSK